MQGEDAREQQVRGDYYALVAALYEQAFFGQIADWCEAHGLLLTGHTEEDLMRHPRRQGDYFRTMRHLQLPGADCHDYRYRFPREISIHEPKYAVSVASAYEKPRAMSEAMGGAGWGCSLQEYKRGDQRAGRGGHQPVHPPRILQRVRAPGLAGGLAREPLLPEPVLEIF